jgi:hypothetical protein
MPFPIFGIIGGGRSSFELFKSGDDYLPSVDKLDPSLTINGTTVTPFVRYKGGDADGTDWDEWTYGDTLTLQAGTAPSYNQGSPLLGTNDDSVLFNSGGYYKSPNTTCGDIGTEDIVVESVFKYTGNNVAGQFSKRLSDGVGWEMFQRGGFDGLMFVIEDSTGNIEINKYGFTTGAWYHSMIFVNRDENSNDGVKWYMNGALEASDNFSTKSGSLSNSTNMTVGARDVNGVGASTEHLAYFAMWKQDNWHSAGASGPAEWVTIAQERFQKLTGFWPQTALGTSAPNGWSTTSGRNSFAHLDRLESGNRKLYLVGTDWLRFVDRKDSNSDSIRGYLSEIDKQNICLQSSDLDTTWTKIDAGDTIGGSVEVPNKETSTTSGIIPDSTDGQHGVTQDITLTATTYTFSVFAKVGSSNWLYIIDTISGDGSYFNLSTCALGTAQGGATAFIEDWGDGWCRCSFQTAGTAAAHTFEISPAGGDGDNTVVGNGSDVHSYVWGVQCEASEYMSSYIPTTTGAVTRATDSLQYKGDDGNLGGTGNNKRGTILFNYMAENKDTSLSRPLITLTDGGSSNDRIALAYYSTGDAFYCVGVADGATKWNLYSGSPNPDIIDGVISTLRHTWKVDVQERYVDGTQLGTGGTGNDVPDNLDQINIGMDATASDKTEYGVIGSLKIWPQTTLKN